MPVTAGLCVALTIAVAARRLFVLQAIADIPPGLTVTSGYETESFFALWRAVHGESVYSDPFKQPFAASYFNWLFYSGYAAPLRFAVGAWGDPVIPIVGRLCTAGGALVGAVSVFLLLRRQIPGHSLLPAAWAAIAFGGPLIGWWMFTLRPDVWALAFEALGTAALLLGLPKRAVPGAVAATLCFYGAWACKQTYVLVFLAALLFLILRRRWNLAVLLGGGMALLMGGTLLVLGPSYRESLFQSAGSSAFSFSIGAANLRDALLKSWPLCAAALLGRRDASAGSNTSGDELSFFARLGVLVSVPLGFAASCKVGAASNYFFSAQLMLCLAAAAGLSRRLPLALPAALVAMSALQLALLAGWKGRLDLRPAAHNLAAIWRVWEKEPEPRFAHVTGFNLPWLSPLSPPLVLAYDYPANRGAGHDFEHDGVGGLIARGEFRSLLLPANVTSEFDQGSLAHYHREREIRGFAIYRRIEQYPP